MEKQAKPKNKILKFLPRAASAVVSFQTYPPFSPSRDKRSEINASKLKAHAGRGYSGPIVSMKMIPDEARRKPKNGGFETQEPTSPKVSCMGQIKHKKKIKKLAKRAPPPQEVKAVSTSSPPELKKRASAIGRIFAGAKPGRKSDAVVAEKAVLPDKAPSLTQMKRFASGRDSLADFDWTAQIAQIDRDQRNYYSDEERLGDSDQEEEEVIIPFSAPLMVGGGVPLQPRNEINLWKRRTMAPPRPLALDAILVDRAY